MSNTQEQFEAIKKELAEIRLHLTGLVSPLDLVLEMLDRDSHNWSTRPCQTCSAISAIARKPFGCVALASRLQKPNNSDR